MKLPKSLLHSRGCAWKIVAIMLMMPWLIACTPNATVLDDGARDRQYANSLNQQLREWRGTPYAYGGNSRRGIDCSGFVQTTFAERFSLKLPRTTQLQAKLGEHIWYEQLQPGDLVFFKTGLRSRHVGIYSGNGKFIHASTSKGVIESDMNNSYWAAHYWKARQILAH